VEEKLKIIVASNNPVKLNAVKEGFSRVYPTAVIEISGVKVESGVSVQPMTDAETLHGAENRAAAARLIQPDADYWVGVEGGIEDIPSEGMLVFAWIVILSAQQVGKGKTGGFYVPPRIAQLVREGKELGDADDLVFGRSNSKQANGAVGILTGDVIDRTRLYVDAVVFALIPHLHPELYPE
jgi:inosine/xanthosine triphosphatase